MNRTFTPELDAGVLKRLEAYAAPFADDFNRPRQRAWCGVYLAGLLQDGERKSIEPLSRRVTLPAALAGTSDPDQGLQQFVSQSSWDEAAIGRRYRTWMAKTFADRAGVFVLDDTTFPKAGSHPVGVQRQKLRRVGQKGQLSGGSVAALRRCQSGPRAVGPASVPAREFGWKLPPGWTRRACQRADAARCPKVRSPWSCSTPSVPRTCCPARSSWVTQWLRGQRPPARGPRRARPALRAGGNRGEGRLYRRAALGGTGAERRRASSPPSPSR